MIAPNKSALAHQGAGAVPAWPLPWMMANLVLLQVAIASVDLRLIVRRVFFCTAFFLASCLVLMRVMGSAGVGVGAALTQALLSVLLVNCILQKQQSSVRMQS